MTHLIVSVVAGFIGGMILNEVQGVTANFLKAWIATKAQAIRMQIQMRHARASMQAKFAQAVHQGRLREVVVKKGGRLVAK